VPPPETAPLSPQRRRLVGCVLAALSLLAALALGELALRLVRPQEVMTIAPAGLYAPDPPGRYRLRPGYRGTLTNHVEFRTEVRIDELGTRGEDRPGSDPARAGELRILAVGDSFTFGVGAEEAESWPARLQATLAARGVASRVWNAGAPGYGVPDEVGWYERHGDPIAPQVVVVAPFLANDLQDAAPGSPVRVVDGELVVGGEGGGARRWLYYHSHLFRLLKSSLLEGRLRTMIGLQEPWAKRERRAELALYGAALPPSLAAGAVATDAAVARLVAVAAERHARVVAVLVPSLPQVDPRRWRALHEELGVSAAGHDPRQPNKVFAAIFARHGVPVIDPTDALAAAVARGERVYWARDQHLTPRGYAILATQVADSLQASR